MNFVVAALILARYRELCSLATYSEYGETCTEIDYSECPIEPNYEAESDVFWLFQVSPQVIFSFS